MSPHLSVLLNEVVEAVAPGPGRLIVDGTFGAGGYSRAFLERGADVIGFDRDPTVQPHAERLAADFGDRFRLVERRFSEMEDELGEQACDGVALDIGVSSMQLDQAERGFSFQKDGPLDMRMGADERAAIRELETEIAQAQRDLRLLRAEAAHLEQPARLQALVDAHLQLQPLDAEQEASPEVLPVVLPTAQQEPAEATQ